MEENKKSKIKISRGEERRELRNLNKSELLKKIHILIPSFLYRFI